MGRLVGLLGLGTMIGLAYLFSKDRKAIRLKTVLWGLGLQLSFAFFVLRFDIGRQIFQVAGDAVNRLLSFSYVGSEFVFGEIGKKVSSLGFSFAFQVLPTIIFMGQTEAPLTIRPFLNKLTKSELMCVMTSGMAHVSGGIMAAYIAFGIEA